MKKKKLPALSLCILLDLAGLASYLLPVAGEMADLVWAPISGVIFYFLFGKKKFGMLGGILSFLEEILPGTDFLPTFTIGWLIRRSELNKDLTPMQNK